MKKILTLILAVVAILCCFVGCDSAKIEVGAKNGVAYFNDSTIVPKMVLKGESEIEIEDKSFFGKLTAAIQDKPTVDPVCDCQPIYNVGIDKYTFGLHTHGITISSPMGKNIKGTNIFAVECTEEEINELLDILDSVSCAKEVNTITDFSKFSNMTQDGTDKIEVTFDNYSGYPFYFNIEDQENIDEIMDIIFSSSFTKMGKEVNAGDHTSIKIIQGEKEYNLHAFMNKEGQYYYSFSTTELQTKLQELAREAGAFDGVE